MDKIKADAFEKGDLGLVAEVGGAGVLVCRTQHEKSI